MDTAKIFQYLETFKNFPTYQFERRIDAFLLPYLETVFNKHFKETFEKNNLTPDFKFVFPEFPLKRGGGDGCKNANERLSEHADYLMWSKSLNKLCLVELKTDVNSMKSNNYNQFRNYNRNCLDGWNELLHFYYKKITPNNWRKFLHGLKYIKNVSGELLGTNYNKKLEEFIIKDKGQGVTKLISSIRDNYKNIENPELSFIYIIPTEGVTIIKRIKQNFPDETKCFEGYLTLSQFAKYVNSPLQELLISIDKKNLQ
jgi:hypothetical protein